jgi:4-nitrophenyl phosphatase
MPIRGVILDLDGTLYHGTHEVPGAVAFVRRLAEGGIRRLFVTNRANRPPSVVAEQLRGMGLECSDQDVFTSAEATASYLNKGRAFVIGMDGIRQALTRQGIAITDQAPDYVVVSMDTEFTYEKLARACTLIRDGAKFIATNPDRGLNTEQGVLPGTGAIVAAVTAATGVEPVVVGKPQPLIIEAAMQRLGTKPAETLVVGDNIETDVPAGFNAGALTALILTGISSRRDLERSRIRPTWVVDDYEALWRKLVAVP